MNLADSMRSQDNNNKVVSQEREKGNLLPVDRMTDISIHRLDQQINGKKNRKYVSSDNQS